MPGDLQKILYTAEAVVEGGREGHARSMDVRLVVDLAVRRRWAVPGSLAPTPNSCSPQATRPVSGGGPSPVDSEGAVDVAWPQARQRLHAPRLNGNRTGRR